MTKSSSSSSDSDAKPAPAKVAAKKPAASSSSSDSDAAPAKKAVPAPAKVAAKKAASSSSSDSDAAPAKKTTPAPAKAAAKKDSSSSSSDDDKAPAKAAPAKAAAKKAASSSSSDSDAAPAKKATPAPAKKADSSSSSSDEETKAPAKAAPAKGTKRGRDDENEGTIKKSKAENGAAVAADGATFTAFVGGLSFQADEAGVREFFGDCGEVVSVRLPTHRDTGKPKGIAFVEFATKEGLDGALGKDGQEMLGRYLAIKVSESTGKPAFGGARDNKGPRDQALSEKPEGCKTVFVGNLSWQATEDDLKAAFESCGTVWNVRLAVDKETGKSKGFAHVEFEDEAGPEAAVKLTGTEVAGRAIRVDYAGSSQNGGGREGGGGGGRGRGGSRGGPRGGGFGSRGRGGPRGGGRGGSRGGAFAANKGTMVASQGKKITFE